MREANGDIDQAQRAQNHRPLHEGFRRCNALPQALASGATSLTHKVAALLYCWCLGRRPENFSTSITAYCTSFFV